MNSCIIEGHTESHVSLDPRCFVEVLVFFFSFLSLFAERNGVDCEIWLGFVKKMFFSKMFERGEYEEGGKFQVDQLKVRNLGGIGNLSYILYLVVHVYECLYTQWGGARVGS